MNRLTRIAGLSLIGVLALSSPSWAPPEGPIQGDGTPGDDPTRPNPEQDLPDYDGPQPGSDRDIDWEGASGSTGGTAEGQGASGAGPGEGGFGATGSKPKPKSKPKSGPVFGGGDR